MLLRSLQRLLPARATCVWERNLPLPSSLELFRCTVLKFVVQSDVVILLHDEECNLSH